MREHRIWIDQFQANNFLRAIRSKKNIIVLWMGVIKTFLANTPPVEQERFAELSIVVGSMSRLFCELDGGKKIYSVSFPFNCREVDGSFIFSSRGGVEVDNRISSEIVSLIDRPDGVLDVVAFEGFIDPLFEALEVDLSIWSVVRELMTAEESYLRYDWDAERVNGHRHPLHHIDVGYSSACSFKFGLRQRIGRDGLISILNIDSDCHYIAPAI